VAQVVECPPGKHAALSSNPSYHQKNPKPKKKKKTKKKNKNQKKTGMSTKSGSKGPAGECM
jgi:hypothetical protein